MKLIKGRKLFGHRFPIIAVLAVITIVVVTSMALSHGNEHGHDHAHDQVSARIFSLSEGPAITWVDVLDGQFMDRGSLDLPAFSHASLTSDGRFLGILEPDTSMFHVVSSGLFFEEHGDHFDVVTLPPSEYWQLPLLAQPSLHPGVSGWAVAYPEHSAVAVLRAETGVQTIFPQGGGYAVLLEEVLVSTEDSIGLLDVFRRNDGEREFSLRLPWEPDGMTGGNNSVLLWNHDELLYLELSEKSFSSFHLGDNQQVLDAWQHGETGWIYVLTPSGVTGLDSADGTIVHYVLRHQDSWSLDADQHYLGLVADDGRTVHLLDVGHGGIRERVPFRWEGTSKLDSLVWAGSFLVAHTEQQMVIMDRHGHQSDALDLDFHATQVLVAELRHPGDAHEHHSHEHDDHEHHDHEDHSHDHDDHGQDDHEHHDHEHHSHEHDDHEHHDHDDHEKDEHEHNHAH